MVIGAAPLHPRAVAAAPAGALVIAADGGLDHARAAELEPALLVGDLDSISPGGLAWAEANAEIARHPADKALTDTELALAAAAARDPRHVVVLAGVPTPLDRLDHLLAAVGALGGPVTAETSVEAWFGDQHVHVIRPGPARPLRAAPRTTFSLLALHGPCRGVTVSGARWPLTDFDLDAVAGIGVSNETSAAGAPLSVSVGDGVLTLIFPGAPGGTT